MLSMFYECKNFEGRGLENWDVSNVWYMSQMFYDCNSLDTDLSGWNVDKVKDKSRMFYKCPKMKPKMKPNFKN